MKRGGEKSDRETGAVEAPAQADSERWAFLERGPWCLESEGPAWSPNLESQRERQRSRLPGLLAPRSWPPVGRFLSAALRVGWALLAWRLGAGRRGGEASRVDLSRRLRRSFEALGSAYIKLGQIISSGRGLFPEELVDEFRSCRDQVPSISFRDVRRVIEEDLGAPLESTFARFDRECLAAASIAQVHSARLCSGEEVVVKVQRPTVARLVELDIRAMAWIAPKLVGRIPVAALANPPALVELFAETIMEELDFRLEAGNMLDIARVLRKSGQQAIVVPRPHPRLVTRRVLVMEKLQGYGYEDAQGMKRAGIDTEAVLHALLIAFLEGAMIYGVFHGDLHGGNLFVMQDGRVALLDYGMTGRINEVQRRALLRIMMAGAVNDIRLQLLAFRDLGALESDTNIDELMELLKLDQPVRDPTKMSAEEIVSEIQVVLKGLLKFGARIPKSLLLYGKNMLFFDGAIAILAPDLDMFAEFTRVYGHFASNHGNAIATQIGFDPTQAEVDLSGVKASIGIESEAESLTHRELLERRRLVQEKFEDHQGRAANSAEVEES